MAYRIGIIDDSELVLEWTQSHLVRAGFEVVVHGSGFGIANFITEASPHLLLMDVDMPGITGDFLCKMVKQGDWSQRVRVLLYSSSSERKLSELTRQCGADGFVKKTDDPEELIAQIKLHIAVLGCAPS